MEKSTIQNIIKDIMWSEHDKDPSKPIIFPKYVIYGKNKEIFINSLDYKIEFDDEYVKGTHRKIKQEIFLKYDSITKISELKFFEEYSTIIKTMNVVQPQQYQEIITDTPFEFEVYSESTDELKIYCGDEFLGTFEFVDGVAQGTLTISNGYGKNRLLFVSGNYMDSVIVYVFATDVVKGVPPLIMENAKAGNLIYCIAYGGTELSGTPSPDNPVDIICNNGVIKVDNNGNVYAQGTQETITVGNSSANAEMLMKTDSDFVDEQDILNGIVTRKIGVKVFDGTEDWYKHTNTSYPNTYVSSTAITNRNYLIHTGLSTHFNYIEKTSEIPVVGSMFLGQLTQNINFTPDSTINTLELWKTWLAGQYNAGTPVIVVYPLAKPTTEQVSPQPMSTVEGDNTLEIQQASLSNLEVEAEYVIAND